MNDKLIQIGGKSYNKCQVVMLPTKNREISKIGIIEGKLYSSHKKEFGLNPQHIHILSDEEIKEGDWYICKSSMHPKKCVKIDEGNGCKWVEDYLGNQDQLKFSKKIIATTDESLSLCDNCKKPNRAEIYTCNCEVNPVPRPSDDFLKTFVKAQGTINQILVEYEEY